MSDWELREVEFADDPPVERVKVKLDGEWRWLSHDELCALPEGAEILRAAQSTAYSCVNLTSEIWREWRRLAA